MRVLLVCLIVVLFVSSCAGSVTTVAPTSMPQPAALAVATVTQPAAGAAPTASSTATAASQAASAAPVTTWVETQGFRKSDAKYFAATGRPQFVEFFAFW